MRTLFLAPSTPRLFVIRMVLAVALLQALWIAVVPPFRASDEFDHAYRAAAVADGQWRATQPVRVGRGILVRAPADLVDAAENQCASLGYVGYDNCHSAGDAGDGHVWVGSGAGTYNPLFYWVIGTAAQPFTGDAALYAMRITSALVCLLFIGLGAWAISRRGPPGWSGIGFVLALTPVLVFSTVVAAPNGLEMAAGLALWCSLIAVPDVADVRLERRMLVVAALAAVLLGFLRLLGPLFILLIVATAAILHGRRAIDVIRRHIPTALCCVLAVALSVVWAVGWLWLVRGVGGGEQQGGSDWPWATVILWPLQTIAAFPFRDQPGAAIVYPVVVLAVSALVVGAVRLARRREALVVIASAVLAMALPFGLTVVTKAGKGVMWQGRYGLPLAVGFVLLAGIVIERRATRPPSLKLLVPCAAVLAVSWVACLLKVLRDEDGRWESTSDAAWHPPGLALLAIVCGLSWCLIVAAMSRRATLGGGAFPSDHAVAEREVSLSPLS